MTPKNIAWTIAGSDSGGGAGIQADLHTFHDFDVHGCSVITALTAQNSVEVRACELTSPSFIQSQMDALAQDLPAKALKTGMLGNIDIMKALLPFLKSFPGSIICDPVMIATSGASLLETGAQDFLIQHIFPFTTLITPNLYEAEQLLGRKLSSTEDIEAAAHELLQTGTQSVLIKGGHFPSDSTSTLAADYWTNGQHSFWLRNHRLPHEHTHGAGCTLSAAITACLARGEDLVSALVMAKMYVQQGLRAAQSVGQGPGPVAHRGYPTHRENLPQLIDSTLHLPASTRMKALFSFKRLEKPIGFYPIVETADAVEQLLELGVDTIQIRNKELKNKTLSDEMARAIALAKAHDARLFINDHWSLAIEHGAYGVHLGQEDLATASLPAIEKAGLALGISTHTPFEIARAATLNPSYLALGTIFETQTKILPTRPIGLEMLAKWCKILRAEPVVAIGGITLATLPAVLKAGASGVAVIRAIQTAQNLEQTVAQWRKLCETQSK